jgi:hypothetical protein
MFLLKICRRVLLLAVFASFSVSPASGVSEAKCASVQIHCLPVQHDRRLELLFRTFGSAANVLLVVSCAPHPAVC